MSRPGWSALRVLALTAVSFAVLAPPSFGQAPSLTGESLESTLNIPGQETTFGNFTCNKAGDDDDLLRGARFRVRALLRHLRRVRQLHHRPAGRHDHRLARRGPVTAFQASFTIDSTFPVGRSPARSRVGDSRPRRRASPCSAAATPTPRRRPTTWCSPSATRTWSTRRRSTPPPAPAATAGPRG